MAGQIMMDAYAELERCRTYFELVKAGESVLREAGCPEPGTDARLLLFHFTGWDLARYAARGSEVPGDANIREYALLINRRAKREPLQYITGSAPFFGYDFHVTPDVLIPRFDTEVLVSEVLSHVREGDRILDMCTGSGCIAITIWLEAVREGRNVNVTASDISPAALCVAAENAQVLGAQITTLESDLFGRIAGTYDIITVNPPYIETEVIKTLDPEVRLFEPKLALDGMADGLFFYRKIVHGAGPYLANGGLLALEIGNNQSREVEALMRAGGYDEVRTVRDLAGNDRCVLGVLNKE